MGAIADYTTYKSLRAAPHQTARVLKEFNGQSTTSGVVITSTWLGAGTPDPGVAPSTAVVPDRATTGALGQRNPNGSNQLRLIEMLSALELEDGWIALIDRLSHQGGLSGTVTTEQTTNLPTAALTRGDTSGVGVYAGLEVYTQIGATATLPTIRYTNSAGTANRISPAAQFGATGRRNPGAFAIMPMASGDKGVRSVEGVTLDVTSGTAGNFGVTLFRILGFWPYTRQWGHQPLDEFLQAGGVSFAAIPNDACLAFIGCTGTSADVYLKANLSLVES